MDSFYIPLDVYDEIYAILCKEWEEIGWN